MEVINPQGTLICPQCGHSNDERAFFCSNCGRAIGSRAGRANGNGADYQPHYNYDYREDRGRYYDGLPLISLLVTILGFFISGFIGPLIGVILAHASLRRQRRRGDYSNRGLAIASLIIGYFLLIVGLIILIAFGALVGTSLLHSGISDGNWNYM